MKTITVLAKSLVFTSLLLITSCSNDSSSSSNNPAGTSQTSFKLDGVLITPDDVTATLYNNTIVGGQYLDVYAFKAGEQVLELHMPATTGSYPAQHAGFAMTNSWLTYEANNGVDPMSDYFHSDSGTMNLTTCDLTANKLVGTFSFVGNNGTTTKTITEGNLVVNEITHQP